MTPAAPEDMSTKPRRKPRAGAAKLNRGGLPVAGVCLLAAVLLYVLPPHSLIAAVIAASIGALAVVYAFGALELTWLTGLAVGAYVLAAIVAPLSISWLAIAVAGGEETCAVTAVDTRAERDEERSETTYTYVHTLECSGERVTIEKSRQWAEPGTEAEVLRDGAGLLRPDFVSGRTPAGVLILLAMAAVTAAVAGFVTRAVLRLLRSSPR